LDIVADSIDIMKFDSKMWHRMNRRLLDRAIPRAIPRRVSDLASQLEDLRVFVLDCERWARFDDRLDLAMRCMPAKPKRI
jgi:hypothetical protein